VSIHLEESSLINPHVGEEIWRRQANFKANSTLALAADRSIRRKRMRFRD